MKQVHIHVVHLEPVQTVFNLAQNVATGQTTVVWSIANRFAYLCRHDEVGPVVFPQYAPDDLLRVAVLIRVGSVYKVDPPGYGMFDGFPSAILRSSAAKDRSREILERIVGTRSKTYLAEAFKLAFAEKYDVKREEIKQGIVDKVYNKEKVEK